MKRLNAHEFDRSLLFGLQFFEQGIVVAGQPRLEVVVAALSGLPITLKERVRLG